MMAGDILSITRSYLSPLCSLPVTFPLYSLYLLLPHACPSFFIHFRMIVNMFVIVCNVVLSFQSCSMCTLSTYCLSFPLHTLPHSSIHLQLSPSSSYHNACTYMAVFGGHTETTRGVWNDDIIKGNGSWMRGEMHNEGRHTMYGGQGITNGWEWMTLTAFACQSWFASQWWMEERTRLAASNSDSEMRRHEKRRRRQWKDGTDTDNRHTEGVRIGRKRASLTMHHCRDSGVESGLKGVEYGARTMSSTKCVFSMQIVWMDIWGYADRYYTHRHTAMTGSSVCVLWWMCHEYTNADCSLPVCPYILPRVDQCNRYCESWQNNRCVLLLLDKYRGRWTWIDIELYMKDRQHCDYHREYSFWESTDRWDAIRFAMIIYNMAAT